MDVDADDVRREGYATDIRHQDRPGFYSWVCGDCFRDLRGALGWTVAQE